VELIEGEIPTGVNFNRLLKKEILWLYNHYCRHNHRYSEHPTCFLEECRDGLPAEKMAFVDIETSNLDADFGYIFCYSLKEQDGELIHRCVTPKEIRGYKFDQSLMRQFLKDIKGYDRLVGYYSKDRRFDIPYLRSRALKWGLDFPGWRDLLFTDAFDLVKPKLKLHRNRLEVACDFLGIPSKEHRLNPEVWQRALAGSKQALDYIQVHCDEDVLSLEAVFKRLNIFGSQGKTSI
jgi:uncharacterized protein YprB with RNaseH-like and TPR domain